MKLVDLEPTFLRLESPDGKHYRFIDLIADAQGIQFWCPKCQGTGADHPVQCWFALRGVPDTMRPGPGRWVPGGTSYHDLTLEAAPGKSRSVLLKSGCCWHGFVTSGEVTDA